MHQIFIDTNIFLHFQNIQTIQWNKILNVEECNILIAPVIIDELDEKKRGNDPKSNLARTALKLMEDTIDNGNTMEIRKGVLLTILSQKPKLTTFESNLLEHKEKDHRLLASMLEYRDSLSENEQIYLCSDDIGPRLGAKNHGFEILKLDDKFKKPIEDSEDRKLIKRLEKELITLKSNVPNLDVKFPDLKQFIKFKKQHFNTQIEDDYVKEKMLQLELQYPKLKLIDENPMYRLGIGNLSETQINKYNTDLKLFFEKCKLVYSELYYYELQKKLTFNFSLSLWNTGTAPGKSIDIHFHFPDGFEMMETIEIASPPKIPIAPFKPKNAFDFDRSSFLMPRITPIDFDINQSLSVGPNIKKTNSYDIHYKRKVLKHGYQSSLESLSIIFNSREEVKNFTVDYKITADNLPIHKIGKLNFIFEE